MKFTPGFARRLWQASIKKLFENRQFDRSRAWHRGIKPALEPLEERLLLSSVPQWVEQGPGPIQSQYLEHTLPSGGSQGEIGAIESLAVEPINNAADNTEHFIVYAATVNGGIWRAGYMNSSGQWSGDITPAMLAVVKGSPAADPTTISWIPLSDYEPSLAISSLALDPNDLTGNTLWAGTGSLSSKDVGTGKTVTIGTITLGGADAGDYTLSSPPATTTADIAPASVTVTATGNNKVYDSTTATTVNLTLNGVLGSDNVTASDSGDSFVTKDAGTGKTVTIGTITLGGADAGDYTLSSPPTTTPADITPAPITVTATGKDKSYDGNTSAQVTLVLTGVLAGDTGNVKTTAYNPTFDTPDEGVGKSITIGPITLEGTAISNYVLVNPPVTTTATIKKLLAVDDTYYLPADGNDFSGQVMSNDSYIPGTEAFVATPIPVGDLSLGTTGAFSFSCEYETQQQNGVVVDIGMRMHNGSFWSMLWNPWQTFTYYLQDPNGKKSAAAVVKLVFDAWLENQYNTNFKPTLTLESVKFNSVNIKDDSGNGLGTTWSPFYSSPLSFARNGSIIMNAKIGVSIPNPQYGGMIQKMFGAPADPNNGRALIENENMALTAMGVATVSSITSPDSVTTYFLNVNNATGKLNYDSGVYTLQTGWSVRYGAVFEAFLQRVNGVTTQVWAFAGPRSSNKVYITYAKPINPNAVYQSMLNYGTWYAASDEDVYGNVWSKFGVLDGLQNLAGTPLDYYGVEDVNQGPIKGHRPPEHWPW